MVLTSDNIQRPQPKIRKVNNQKIAVPFLVSLLLILLTFMPMLLRVHYSSDSYHLLADQHTMWYLQCGRYTFWVFACFFEKIGVNLVLSQRWFIAFCILILAICTTILYKFFKHTIRLRENGKALILIVPLSLIWCNVFMEDWILFPEVAGMIALAAIFLTLSIVVFFKNNTGFFSLLLSGILLLISLGSYQSMVGSFIAATVLISCIKYRGNTHHQVASCLKGIAIGTICAIINVLILKLLVASGLFGESGRGSTFNIIVIIFNLLQVIKYQLPFWINADGLLPIPSMQILEIALILLFISTFRKSSKDGLTYLLAFIISLGAAYAPHYVESTITLTPRSNIAVWMAIGFTIAVLLCENFEESHINSSVASSDFYKFSTSQVTTGILLAFTLINSTFMWDIAYDSYSSNIQDRQYATAVANKIKEYEDETGSTIQKIAIVSDTKPEAKYPETRYHNNQLGTRIMNIDYSRIEMINWVGGLSLQQADTTSSEKVQELFGSKDWNVQELDEQLKFEAETAYLAIY